MTKRVFKAYGDLLRHRLFWLALLPVGIQIGFALVLAGRSCFVPVSSSSCSTPIISLFVAQIALIPGYLWLLQLSSLSATARCVATAVIASLALFIVCLVLGNGPIGIIVFTQVVRVGVMRAFPILGIPQLLVFLRVAPISAILMPLFLSTAISALFVLCIIAAPRLPRWVLHVACIAVLYVLVISVKGCVRDATPWWH